MDVIQASIPFFFLLIALELGFARLRRRPLYRLSDSISDLSCGIVSQLMGIFIALGTIALFAWVQDLARIQLWLPLPEWIARSPLPGREGFSGIGLDLAALGAWVAVFTLDDFAYYWLHRKSHEVNLLWAGHVVHHSSEELNLTVALRQSGLHGLMTWVFYLPLALLGVPVAMWVVCHALNLVYQFWIHTRGIGRLGPLEWVLNTPSHHRVHHGVNPEYQDRNFAGTFIVWDRLFGTFEPERAEPVYGITKPLESWNPVWANLHVFVEIGRNLRRVRRWGDRLRILFGHPSWRPAELGPSIVARPVSPETFEKYEPPVPSALRLYAALHFAAILAGAMQLLGAAQALPTGQVFAGAFYLILSLGNIGGVLEARSWALVSEAGRLVILGGACAVLLALGVGPPWLLGGALVFAAGSGVWLARMRGLFNPATGTRVPGVAEAAQ